MVLRALQFFIGLARYGSCQIGLSRVCGLYRPRATVGVVEAVALTDCV
jgi:hypothetical protein